MSESRRQSKPVAADDVSVKPLTQPRAVSDSEIAQRAYALYLARGCEPGKDVADWLQAEQELKGTAQSAV